MSSTRVSPTAVAEATDQVRATLQRLGVVPVVKIDEAAKAGALGRALAALGRSWQEQITIGVSRHWLREDPSERARGFCR